MKTRILLFFFLLFITPAAISRCHQPHIVNKKFIKSWVKADGGYLLLYDQTTIPVSRQKKDALKDLFCNNS